MGDAVDLIVGQWCKERPDLAEAVGPMEVLGRIQRMQSVCDRHYRKLNQEFGLNMAECDILFTLRRSGPPYTLTAGAFLKAAMVTSGAITNRIDRMEAKGLVERVRESADRRSVQIRLTEHGKALADQAMDAHLRDYEKILSVLTPEEREQIVSGLRKVLEAQGDTALN
ncbi:MULTISPECIES: MarR family winged helix-turn-helix transcriptional regulator [Streptomyces]|uniref:MarR family winged helix-turn-helix transcriptional regulator n=1 Tax=Streptomyces lycopersici TaxID=2974589 RepID=UPI0021CEFEAF|nr:MarR family transcriptional regulator [Streptomyces sp. NEAU-383]